MGLVEAKVALVGWVALVEGKVGLVEGKVGWVALVGAKVGLVEMWCYPGCYSGCRG